MVSAQSDSASINKFKEQKERSVHSRLNKTTKEVSHGRILTSEQNYGSGSKESESPSKAKVLAVAVQKDST